MLLAFFYFFFFAISESVRTKPCHALSFSLVNYDQNMWELSQTDNNIDSYIFSNTDDASLSLTFVGTEYWVEGSTDPIYGSAQINDVEISLNGEHKNNHVYFKSGPIDQTSPPSEQSIVITNVPHRGPISFSRLLYNYVPNVTNVKQNGLIRVYYNEMEYSTEWSIANQRMSTNQEGASASCHFNGIKAYIYAYKCPGGGLFSVYIDDEFQDIINLQSTISEDLIVYESNDLPFGQHKIEVRSVSSKPITIIFFLYRPHLIFDALVYGNRFWSPSQGEGIIPTYSEGNTQKSVSVRCTRFWIVGFKGPGYGSFNISVSDQNIEVSTYSETETFHSVLLYESPVLEYGAHTIQVTPLNSATIAINDVLFCQQPKDAVVIYGKDLKKSGSYVFNPNRHTYGINNLNSKFQFSYYGDQFYVYGEKDNGLTRFSITDNDQPLSGYTITDSGNSLVKLYEAKPSFGNHDITFTQTETPTNNNRYLYISYIFYLTYSNPPFGRFENLTKDNIASSVNTIDTSDDYIELPVIGSKVVFEYSGSNFTLEGFLGPASGNVNIYHNDNLLNSGVPLYREENKFSWFYSSEELIDDIHRITIVNCNGNPVYISKLCYKPLPPTGGFTPSTAFTNSESFSKSLFFSNSESFTKSLYFSGSESFTESLFFSGSESFTESIFFSNSELFSNSESFTESLFFSGSESFSKSLFFSGSESFTESLFFSNSETYTKSIDFTVSELFTESLYFSDSESFSRSLFFSGSESFTGSLSFSNSETYTKSIDFTVSEPFTISSLFSDSNEFTPNITQYFSSSLEFSTSQLFTKSLSFSNSETFSKSLTFSSSKSFTTSESFSLSSSFSLSISFSASFDFDYQAGRDTKPNNQTNIIIGVCVAILALLVIALIIIFLVLRKRKQSDIENDQYDGYEANASTINLFSAATQDEDVDTIANSHDNDLFDERMMSDEEDESDSGHYGR